MTDAAGRAGEEPRSPAGMVNEVEGYLLCRARIAEARQRARAFTEPLEWLTTAQREHIEEHYVRVCLVHAREDLQRVADRCRELRAEYEDRYLRLRARCVAWSIAGVAGAAAMAMITVAAQRS
ncbi:MULTISPECIES: cytochrome C oxidase subunit I [Streptomyces]|uniref:cytochrome C oxidase subunit I n=1 Tax=Streptomyces TaxID=1883 RepID=UPI00136ADA9A|nr:cytochrome C oxidase subunit I [Streptomyces sp. SID2888]MYV50478.1 cytochrome C oxidase subunit I [Streptomyces sp. SID2888]